MNLYQYCGNNPTNYIDPTGTDRYILTDTLGLHHWIGVDVWGQKPDGTWYKTGTIIQSSVYAYESATYPILGKTYPMSAIYKTRGYYKMDGNGNQNVKKITVRSSRQEDLRLLEQLQRDSDDGDMSYGILNLSSKTTYCVPYSFSRLYTGIEDIRYYNYPPNDPRYAKHIYNSRHFTAFYEAKRRAKESEQKGKP